MHIRVGASASKSVNIQNVTDLLQAEARQRLVNILTKHAAVLCTILINNVPKKLKNHKREH